MHYTVYQTTNLINGKVYIGIHATEDPNDTYLGSGQALRVAVQKYGRASFKKEILFIFDNPEEMSAKEAEIVTREFVDREDTYNLVPGGCQGDAWYQSRKDIEYDPAEMGRRGSKGAETWKLLWEISPEWKERRKKELSATARRRDHSRLRTLGFTSFKGRKHSSETIEKMRSTARGQDRHGKRNPSFGTVWVCSPQQETKKVTAPEALEYLTRGWVRGRRYI